MNMNLNLKRKIVSAAFTATLVGAAVIGGTTPAAANPDSAECQKLFGTANNLFSNAGVTPAPHDWPGTGDALSALAGDPTHGMRAMQIKGDALAEGCIH